MYSNFNLSEWFGVSCLCHFRFSFRCMCVSVLCFTWFLRKSIQNLLSFFSLAVAVFPNWTCNAVAGYSKRTKKYQKMMNWIPFIQWKVENEQKNEAQVLFALLQYWCRFFTPENPCGCYVSAGNLCARVTLCANWSIVSETGINNYHTLSIKVQLWSTEYIRESLNEHAPTADAPQSARLIPFTLWEKLAHWDFCIK